MAGGRNQTPKARGSATKTAKKLASEAKEPKADMGSSSGLSENEDGSTGGTLNGRSKIRGFFMTSEGARSLALYEYHSAPLSAIDRVLNPYWTLAASVIPNWISPNMVTFLGLCAQFSAFVLGIVHDLGYLLQFVVSLTESIPLLQGADITTISYCLDLFVFYYTMACFVFYHVADAADGKHARNTGQSTPLGALVDHGCDAWSVLCVFNCALSAIFRKPNALAVASVGGTAKTAAGLFNNDFNPRTHPLMPLTLMCYHFAVFASFFVAQWAHYHTGVLDTANVTEGQIVYLLMLFLLSFATLRHWSHYYTGYEVKEYNTEFMTWIIWASIVIPLYVTCNTMWIVKKAKRFRRTAGTFLIPYGIHMIQSLSFLRIPNFWQQHFFKLIVLMSLTVVYMSLRAIVAQLCATKIPKVYAELLIPVSMPIAAYHLLLNKMVPQALLQFLLGVPALRKVLNNPVDLGDKLMWWCILYTCSLSLFFMFDVIMTICRTLHIPFLAPLRKPWRKTNFELADRFTAAETESAASRAGKAASGPSSPKKNK
ncbi:unnamed protein product [Amoebophrya sp. A120]|nr:unnamed protein product [Amoebophrya sp. A120]|eukprot:GSA120T00002851001.1